LRLDWDLTLVSFNLVAVESAFPRQSEQMEEIAADFHLRSLRGSFVFFVPFVVQIDR